MREPEDPDPPVRALLTAIEPEQFALFVNEGTERPEESRASDGPFSDFIVYVDESGDHGMQNVDPNFPVFCLALCVFYKRHYCEKVVPALQKFKFNYFGHDYVVLHEHDIRKEQRHFKFASKKDKQAFLNQLTGIIGAHNFILISCVIDKARLQKKPDESSNPYHIALGFCLETLYEFLQEKHQENLRTHVVVECRGKKEDQDLELEFLRVCTGTNRKKVAFPFQLVFVDKKANSAGLQLADLVARPIALNVLRPNQENRAFEVLKKKFFCSGGRARVGSGYEDRGLKIFPAPESEKPR